MYVLTAVEAYASRYDEKSAVPREPSEIDANLAGLSERFDALRVVANQLRDRLGPVLRPEGPTNTAAADRLRDASVAPLSTRIEALGMEVDMTTEILRDVLSRLAV